MTIQRGTAILQVMGLEHLPSAEDVAPRNGASIVLQPLFCPC